MSKPFIILSGAIKNIGDFLIFDRTKKLLEKYVTTDLTEFPRGKSLDENYEEINNSRGIIICGGPGYTSEMYPGVYPLFSDLKRLRVPVIPLGVGWSGKPKNAPENFRFSEPSRKLMDYIEKNAGLYSCRDQITEEILKREKYEKVVMTGCPVWYDIPSFGKEFSKKKEIKKIVFTTPADMSLFGQTLRMINMLRRQFPKSQVIVSFHRGIAPDKYTGIRSAGIYTAESVYSKLRGFKTVDVSYDLQKIDFYKDCDLHVGFRVHAHLYFLSKRLPSVLISEDGRGTGMSRTFGLPDFESTDKMLPSKIAEYLTLCEKNNFENMSHTAQFIDNQFSVMLEFLNQIKNL
jgi:hypothetical protein